jgi:hypothetical protein
MWVVPARGPGDPGLFGSMNKLLGDRWNLPLGSGPLRFLG